MTPRHTVYGGPQVEDLITRILDDARQAMAGVMTRARYRAVLLIGGYGRGEGGVVTDGGEERPHNNLDFLVITRPGVNGAELKHRLTAQLAPVAGRHRIGMDVGVISERQLLGAPCLVMWHDMRFGHRLLLGDQHFVPALHRFRPDAIEPWDVRNLLVNRGTLLVINELILAKPVRTEADRRTVIRHAVKAIIGYGDALLYFLGEYHWSYREKQIRMAARHDVPAPFRRLYQRAIEFRFRPAYHEFAACDLARWNRTLREALGTVHLQCERLRLGVPGLEWDGYADAAFGASLREALRSPRTAARRLRALAQAQRPIPVRGLRARIGMRLSPGRDRLPLLFPGVAYPSQAAGMASLAAGALAVTGGLLAPERAYLTQWGIHGDANFVTALQALGLSLQEAA